jgi:hypothetical protein
MEVDAEPPLTLDAVRRFALSLPGTQERPHFELSSFRVGTKIFVSVPPGGDVVHVFVGEHEARAAVSEHPDAVELLWWGTRLSGVRVRLALAPAPVVLELVEQAWRRKSPGRPA